MESDRNLCLMERGREILDGEELVDPMVFLALLIAKEIGEPVLESNLKELMSNLIKRWGSAERAVEALKRDEVGFTQECIN